MAIVSDILQATPAPADGSPTPARTWQWLRDGAAITSATSSAYTTVDADANRAITVRQTETNFMGATSATSIAFAIVDPFEVVAALFSLSEPGVWLDPSDTSTLFQDVIGTTPVTATGQTVALALDKSRGLALGTELVTNGNFATDTSWNKNIGWSISGGVASINGSNAASSVLSQSTVVTVVGRFYRITFNYSVTAGTVRLNTAQFGTTASLTAGTSGVFTATIAAIGTTGSFGIQAQVAGTIATIDNISVKELAGNHLTQATAASRPIYGIEPFGGRRNLLTRTEEFENAAWTKNASSVTANSSTAPDGTTTADTITDTVANDVHVAFQSVSVASATTYTFSAYVKAGTLNHAMLRIGGNAFGIPSPSVKATLTGSGSVTVLEGSVTNPTIVAVGGGWYRVSFTSTTVSSVFTAPQVGPHNNGATAIYTGSGTGTVLSWGAQLETGSLATPYQRVTDQWNVTEAGKASVSYLSFDGTDDFLVSPTITPGIDKAQVFAGVRKLSDAAYQVVVEYSANVGSQAGSLSMLSTSGAGTAVANALGFGLRGAATVGYDATSFSAPGTYVASAQYDIAGAAVADEVKPRVNGAVPTLTSTGAANAGTGNYLAYPLYVGRRGGTSLPFNGRLYQLIVRFGTNLSATRIARTEQLINEKTGAIVPPVSTLSLDFIAQEYDYGL